MLTRVAAVVAAAILVVGCGQTDGEDTRVSSTSVSSGGSEPSTTAASPSSSLPSDPDPASDTTQATSPEPTEASVPDTPFLEGLGLDPVVLESPDEGPRPTLSWESLEGAAGYSVLVMDPDGLPWWAWSGEETQVVLGGVDTTADIGGPRATSGATWVVFAFDADGALIGASSRSDVGE